ncbi:hypothetical protein G3U99_24365 [Vibrio coralliilyticus OCN008]|uniref:hypothetical protein n=1 Tax=Vibrio coralliilyticus TaxID=190893 RepID=UPI0003911FBD|nr:hypothetical protein [Vibrio coralliilyticus]ERB66542.1 hypothetical protein N779_03985 [Vibrio coralliilyticus OCN008]QIJ85871.1 hypothetical protein G3U99_24365 [Vibrio coralliilyticus OCN008]
MEKFNRLKYIELCCRDTIQSLTMYKELEPEVTKNEIAVEIEYRNHFWAATSNNLIYYSVLRWCSVFGVREEDTHWRNAFSNEICSTRNELLEAIDLDEPDWESVHAIIKTFRDKLIAHADICAVVDTVIPHLDIMIESAKLIRRKAIDAMSLEHDPHLVNTLKSRLTNERCIEEAKMRVSCKNF